MESGESKTKFVIEITLNTSRYFLNTLYFCKAFGAAIRLCFACLGNPKIGKDNLGKILESVP